MESDSDSDGSHISATPPRPKPPTTRISSIKPSTSKPAKKLFPDPPVSSQPDPFPPLPSDLPFHILRRPLSTSAAANSSTPSPWFSKHKRHGVDFDPSTYDPPSSVSSFSPPQNPDPNTSDWAPPPPKKPYPPPAAAARIVKNVNLIRGNAPLPAVKLKGGNEGNFVKLNLNGRKRKFLNKGKRVNSNNHRRSQFPRRKPKRKLPAHNDDETDETNCGVNDDADVTNAVAPEEKPESKKARKFETAEFEEAVALAREEGSDENLARLLKAAFGYDSFRDGQVEAIRNVVAGESTMVVLPTGAGKSLCYQLPAVILPGVTLVVSPLIALMVDQMKQLPHMIRGGIICSNQTMEEVTGTIRMVQEGSIKVLFISPERLLNVEFLSIFSATTVSLVVVDEAHCVSEWSHNFRPSYMRLRASMLRSKLNVNCILAMTATATTTTLSSVMSALEILPTNLIQKANLRDNLQQSVSSSGNRMKDLLKLIKSTSLKDVQSIIIYCKFQFETEMISRYLCDNNINAKCYHSGLLSKDRTRVQELFFNNKIRVVVATVAFGMGLDKRDIGSVIHYTIPESLEGYVQEIGRAGRDGRTSYCHLYFDDSTYFKLRSLMYSDGVDEYVVNKFLCHIFPSSENFQGKNCSLVKETASRKFDMKEEVMLTILTQLELGEMQYLHLLPVINVTCILNFHKTSPVLLAGKDVIIAAILKKSEIKQGQYVFDIPTIANCIGVTTTILSNHLQNLKVKEEVRYEVKDQAICYTIKEVPTDICSLSAQLTKWLSDIESCKVRKLDVMYNAVVSAVNACETTEGCSDGQQTLCLQKKILEYFNGGDDLNVPNKMGKSSPFLHADIKVFLKSNSQAKYTPRAVARIMHGIPSPAYTSAFWSKTHFWGRYTNIDFQAVMEAAKAELISFVKKDAV